MIIQIFGKKLLLILVIIATIFSQGKPQCQNTTYFHYELNEPTDIGYYNTICSQHTKRTCCSPSDFQTLDKTINKIIGSSAQLSEQCKNKITSLLCSTCDGDIGQNRFDGVCGQYCTQIYQDCKNDLFSIDANNQLRICRQDDIICSSLTEILSQKDENHICQLFEYPLSNGNCWNGEVSSQIKGRALKKLAMNKANPKIITSKQRINLNNSNRSFKTKIKLPGQQQPPKTKSKPKQKEIKQNYWLMLVLEIFVVIIIVGILIFIYRFCAEKYRNWIRESRKSQKKGSKKKAI